MTHSLYLLAEASRALAAFDRPVEIDELTVPLKRTRHQAVELLADVAEAGFAEKTDEGFVLTRSGAAFAAAIEAEADHAASRSWEPFTPYTDYSPERWWPD